MDYTLTQEEYTHLLTEHTEFKHSIDDLDRRIVACEDQQKNINSLTISVDRLTNSVAQLVEEQKSIKEDIKCLKNEPADEFRYYKRLIIGCVITTVIGGLIGGLITYICTIG